MDLQCVICEDKVRRDIALMDAKWECINDKYLCRECAKKIAQKVLEEY